MKIDFNPFEVPTKSLRTLAHFLNCLAADAEGKPQGYSSPATVDPAAVNMEEFSKAVFAQASDEQTLPPPPPLAPNPGNSQDAHGASGQAQPDPAAVPAASNTADAGELDKNGFPWDARIHSSSKNTNQDGTWRYTRGGDPAVRAQVEAELRAKGYGTAAASDTPPPPPPVAPAATEQAPPPPPPLPEQATDTPPAATQPLTGEVFKAMNRLSPDLRTEALGVVGLSTPAEFMREVKVRPEIAAPLLEAIHMLLGEE
jgi:hypothetical protein